MIFLLVDGYIRYPKYQTDGRYLLDEETKNSYLQKHTGARVEELAQPSSELLAAVEGKYFEKYSEAQGFLSGLEG